MNQQQSTRAIKAIKLGTSIALGVSLALGLVACKKGESGPTQVAAKVNKEEISIHQINFLLQQQPGLKPEQTEQASKAILESLIDQELAYQKAKELKVDRDPRVVQALDAAQRQIIARAYFQKLAEAVPRPTEQEIKQFYDSHPALTTQRRIYAFQEILAQVPPEKMKDVANQLQTTHSVQEMLEILKSDGINYGANQAVRRAEQLPFNQLDTYAAMKDGSVTLHAVKEGLLITVLAGSKTEPFSMEQAKPLIENWLIGQANQKMVTDEIKNLRASAKIEYMGSFKPGPNASGASAPAAAASEAPALAPAPDASAAAAPAIVAPATEASAASAP